MQTLGRQFYESMIRGNDVILICWGYSQLFLPLFVIYAFFKAAIELLRKDIDIVQIGDLALSPLGLALKIIFKKPVLTVSHGKDSVHDNVLYNFLVIGSAKRLDKIICVSGGIKEKLIGRGFPEEQLVVIPNGIFVSDAAKELTRNESMDLVEEKYGINLKNKRIIFSAARLVPKKGINEFIKNIFPIINRNCPDAFFLVAGDGSEKMTMLNTIDNLKLNGNIFLAGSLANDSVVYKALFAISDVFVMPNVRRRDDFEGFGIIILEAGLNGLPIVAYDVDGIKEALHGGSNGILINEGDTIAFANAVCSFLNNHELQKEFSIKSKEYVKSNFNWEKIGSRYMDIYKSLPRGSQRAL